MKAKNTNTQEILLSMYEKLVTGHELDSIAQTAVSHLENPLIIADKSCRLLYSTGLPQQSDNPVWHSIQTEGYYPMEYLEALASNPRYSRVYTETAPILLEDNFPVTAVLCSK